MGGKAAVDGDSEMTRRAAEVFLAARGRPRRRRSQSRDRPQRGGRCIRLGRFARAFDHAGDLMAERERQRASRATSSFLSSAEREIAVLQVQVGMAHAATLNAHQHFVAAGCGQSTTVSQSGVAVGDERLAMQWSAPPLMRRRRPLSRAHRARERYEAGDGNVFGPRVGSRPAAAINAGVSPPSARRLWRSILRRWPKAAWVAVSRLARSQGSGAAA